MKTTLNCTAVACALLAAALAAGCSATPEPKIDTRITETTGAAVEVVFMERGRPTDEAEASPSYLSLDYAVRRSLEVDPRLQAAIARVRMAQADAHQARLLPNPVLSVIFRWPDGGGKPEIDAGLSADLIALLSKRGQVSVADNRLRAASADALATSLDVLAEVQTNYLAIQANDQLLKVLEERQRIIDRLLQVARTRLDAGEGTRLDSLSLQSQQVELRTEIAERQLERREARLVLARLIGQPSGAVDWQVQPWTANTLPAGSERSWIATALTFRPELQKQRYELAALGAERKLSGFALFDGAEVAVEAERTDGEWSVGPGASVPVPIFDWGQARRDKADAAISEASHQLTQLRRQIVEEVRREHGVYLATAENLDRVRKELIPLARQRQEQAEAQFQGGQTDITGLLQAEEESRAARTRQVELERRNGEALIRLRRAVGGPKVATMASTPYPATAPTTQP